MNYLIQSKGKCPDSFSDAARRNELILKIERILEDADFDDIDTTFNSTRGEITPSGSTIYQLEEASWIVGKNGSSILTSREVLDPAEFRLGSRNGAAGFFGVSDTRRQDGVEELLAAIIVSHDEEDRSGLSSEFRFLVRDERRSTQDDAQFFVPLTLNRKGANFECPIFINGQYVGGAFPARDSFVEKISELWYDALMGVLNRLNPK